MYVVDLTNKTAQEMIDIITKAGRTAEKWEEVKKNLNTRTPKSKEKPNWKPREKFRVKKDFKPRKEFKDRKFVDRQSGGSVKTFAAQTNGVPQAELDRRKKERECMRGAWPADRKGNHKMMDSFIPVKSEAGTVNLPKQKQYQKLRVGEYELEEDQRDLYTEGSDSQELRDTASGSVKSESAEGSEESFEDTEESSERIDNWWSD
jgi:hypothetical protein